MIFDISDRILVYPVDRKSLSIIESSENYSSIHLCQLVSPLAWGYENYSARTSEGQVMISHDYETALCDCTAVWFVDSWNELDFIKFIEPAFRSANQQGKKVVCSRKLTDNERASLSDLEITYIDYSIFTTIPKQDDRISEVVTPVIYVLSSTEYCNQFYVETALTAALRNRDYKTLLVSSQKEGVAFNEATLPGFLFFSSFTENEKVIAMNRYICHLEKEYQPEIIIIGVTGAAMPYNNQHSSDFGIIAYEMSEAIKPDFSIMCSPCLSYEHKSFEEIEKSIFGRLGVCIDIHSLSPFALDYNEISTEKRLGYLSLDEKYVQDMISKIDYTGLLNLNTMNGISSAADRVIDKLSGGAGSLIT